jgi:hypothetical protein
MDALAPLLEDALAPLLEDAPAPLEDVEAASCAPRPSQLPSLTSPLSSMAHRRASSFERLGAGT